MGQQLKTLFSALVLAVSVVVSSLAQAQISWQTQPVLGFSSTQGAGPGFDSGSGNWISSVYVATGTGVITLPQYSIVGDVFYQVGAWTPTFTNSASLVVWDAAAVNYTAGNTYQITERWDYTGGPAVVGTVNGRTVGSIINAGTYSDGSYNGIVFWHSDNLPFLNNPLLPNGTYTYTQTWTNTSNPADSITFARPFTVAAVPEPETYAMMLAGLGLMGFVARRRRQSQDSASGHRLLFPLPPELMTGNGG